MARRKNRVNREVITLFDHNTETATNDGKWELFSECRIERTTVFQLRFRQGQGKNPADARARFCVHTRTQACCK